MAKRHDEGMIKIAGIGDDTKWQEASMAKMGGRGHGKK
jgi:hypothetical protein